LKRDRKWDKMGGGGRAFSTDSEPDGPGLGGERGRGDSLGGNKSVGLKTRGKQTNCYGEKCSGAGGGRGSRGGDQGKKKAVPKKRVPKK